MLGRGVKVLYVFFKLQMSLIKGRENVFRIMNAVGLGPMPSVLAADCGRNEQESAPKYPGRIGGDAGLVHSLAVRDKVYVVIWEQP